MGNRDIGLLAHLTRRAGFGATWDELESVSSKGYDAAVEELLASESPKVISDDMVRRYHHELSGMMSVVSPGTVWLYRMATTTAPLQEKLALFWHSVFATGYTGKVVYGKVLMDQIRMFRRYGLGSFRTLLAELARDPAMIAWLDNLDNHNGAINENFGRELLELFSLGVGNYTEEDIKECSRAFTGWTIGNSEYMSLRARRDSIWPYGRIAWHFKYRPEDHDSGEKTFLGLQGRFNGEDIVDIICQQPATARFISRHLYHFFVADEPPVAQWPYTPPRDPDAIDLLCDAYFDSDYDMTAMLRVLFNSEFFKSADSWYAKVKSPAELIAGVLRLTGEFEKPRREILDRALQMFYMGQRLADPPSVEGWHQGTEWIDTGTLVERINFATQQMADGNKPGVEAMIGRVAAGNGGTAAPGDLLDRCLEQMGAISLSEETRSAILDFATKGDEARQDTSGVGDDEDRQVSDMLQLVAASHEFQRG